MNKYLLLIAMLMLWSCSDDDNPPTTPTETLQLVKARIGTTPLNLTEANLTDELDKPIILEFSQEVAESSLASSIKLISQGLEQGIAFNLLDEGHTISIKPSTPLTPATDYTIQINETLKSTTNQFFTNLTISFSTLQLPLEITSITVDQKSLLNINDRIIDVALTPTIEFSFSNKVSLSDVIENTQILGPSINTLNITTVDDINFVAVPTSPLRYLSKYGLDISSSLQSADGSQGFEGIRRIFYSALDTTDKFPRISHEALLDKIQRETFKYFYDEAHPVSGLVHERNTSTDLVTSGGSGFGLMCLVVGMERGFITRSEGVLRVEKITSFLENADRFHGVWPHWLSGSSGTTIPFSPNDDGGDLVETSFMAMGLLTVRQYLDPSAPEELAIINKINTLWESIEWNWYTQGGQKTLYWHWSPNFEWEKNHKIGGYNEALITYVLAAASPTYSIDAAVYHEGWARDGNMVNGNDYYGINLPLGPAFGGPLFFSHYSFLGIDPRNLSDQYANYWELNVNHSLINQAHCIANPGAHIGYSASCWGLTASDNHTGYSAHSPTNDRGVITPTAALSAMPYVPDQSQKAMEHFYYKLGDRLWGPNGFYDAINFNENWVASSYLAIDQGPIIIMIENHRTGLLWDLFMSAPEVRAGLDKLQFLY